MTTLTRSQQHLARERVNHFDLGFDGDFTTVVGPEFRRTTIGNLIDTMHDDMIENQVNQFLEERGDLEDMEKDYQLEK